MLRVVFIMQHAKIYNDQDKNPPIVDRPTGNGEDLHESKGGGMGEQQRQPEYDKLYGDDYVSLPQTGVGGMNDTAKDPNTLPQGKNADELESEEVSRSSRDSNDLRSVEKTRETTNVRNTNDSDDEENNPEIRW